MSYETHDHAAWMQQHIDIQRKNGAKMHPSTPIRLSEFQKRVVDILGIVGNGIYNAPINPDKIDWNYGFGVSLVWIRKEFATFDWNALTLLVFLCHEARIRCAISGAGAHNLHAEYSS